MDASASLLTEPLAEDAPAAGGRAGAGRRRNALRALGVVAAAATLYGTFRGIDWALLSRVIDEARAWLPLVLVPSCVALVLECASWQRAFALLGARPSLFALLKVRVGSESLAAVLPLGAVWSETAKPPLLSRYASVPLSTSIAGIVARKYLLLTTHGVYLVLGFWLGYAALANGFESTLGSAWFGVVVLAAAAGVFLSAQLMLIGFRGGRVLESVVSAFRLIPSARARRALAAAVTEARQSDRVAGRFFRAPVREVALAALPCLAGWLLEAFETWLVLRLLGARLDFVSVLGIEVFVNLGRQVLVMLPGGLGAQELGYATFLGTLGVPLEVSAACALVKRLKESVWVMSGLAVLFRPARHGAATLPTT